MYATVLGSLVCTYVKTFHFISVGVPEPGFIWLEPRSRLVKFKLVVLEIRLLLYLLRAMFEPEGFQKPEYTV